MNKTRSRLADGREIIYYDEPEHAVRRTAVDRREPPPGAARSSADATAPPQDADERATGPVSELRYDPLLAEWTAVTAHRNARTHHPPPDACPLCPSRPAGAGAAGTGAQGASAESGWHSEIPEPDYDVVVFENRFPSFSGGPGREDVDGPHGLFAHRPGAGRCEVVCFTSDHDASFADLSEERARLVLDVWTDRTAELAQHPGVEQVFCFENRGAEIGVTLGHPHGQIYGYPFTTPRTQRMLRSADAYAADTGGRNLFDDVVASEEALGDRIVLEGRQWIAFVPHAARWPYEVHLYPRPRVPDLLSLGEPARAEFPGIYLELLRRFDRIFGPGEPPTPYVAAWHQAPFAASAGPTGPAGRGAGSARGRAPRAAGREEFGTHLELFTVRRAPGKLKFLAGSESGMSVFSNDVPPEEAARRLREVASQ